MSQEHAGSDARSAGIVRSHQPALISEIVPRIMRYAATMRRVAIIALAALAAVSCKQVDNKQAGDQIKAYLEKETGAKVTSVVCPDGIEMKKGNNFECTAKLDTGADIVVGVEQRDDAGNVWYQPMHLVVTKQVEDTIAAKMKESGVQGAVDCGEPKLRVVRQGDMFDCAITTGAEKDKLRIEVTDDKGTWQVASGKPQ